MAAQMRTKLLGSGRSGGSPGETTVATVATAPGAGPIAGVRDRLVASERTLAAALSEVELRGEEIESSAKSWRGCARC